MSSSEKFCLRWNDFETNISVALREIREEKDLFDCTLSCGSRQIQAHKLILSACSSFFRSILRQNPHEHPLLYLKGVKYTDLQYVLNFMYHGEVSVAQEDLNSFLAVAEDLQVKGLTQGNSSHDYSNPKSDPLPVAQLPYKTKQPEASTAKKHAQPLKDSKHISYPHSDYHDDDDIQEVLPIFKTEPEPLLQPISYQEEIPVVPHVVKPLTADIGSMNMQVTTREDVYEEDGYDYGGLEGDGQDYGRMEMKGDMVDVVSAYAVKIESGKYSCKLCGFTTRDKYNIRLHLEGKHELGSGYQCNKCAKYVKTRKDLSEHKIRCIDHTQV